MTNPAVGPNPNFNSQFSFQDSMSEEYVKELGTRPQFLEVWLFERGHRTVLLGKAKIVLSDLLKDQPGSGKHGPKFKKELELIPNEEVFGRMGTLPKEIGRIKVAFSLRRSIKEMELYYKELQKAKETKQKPSEILNLLITVEHCENIQTQDDKKEVKTFFYYHFHTFDDIISTSAASKDPVFDDEQSFKVTLDDQMRNFLRSERLEVFFVDDNAPETGVSGNDDDEAGDDDLIGSIQVPLAKLADKGEIKSEAFAIHDLKGN